jgi:hypothetical protein
MAKKYVKMSHINKLFPHVVWKLNHKIFEVKPGKSISKHFAHFEMEVWSTLLPTKTIGV